MTSVTRVEVAPDLSLARVYVSIMGSESQQRLCVSALQKASGRLRRQVADNAVLRQVPQLVFRLDESVQGAFDTVQQIDAAMAELGQKLPWEEDEQEPRTASDPESSAPGAAEATDEEDR